MKVLVIKTSSLGDVIHALPALTDAANIIPNIQFDWVIEEAFAEIPRWHPHVHQVVPMALRRWRKQPWQAYRQGEWHRFKQLLQAVTCDRVIDAQGLVKSAFITYLSRGVHCGLDWDSAWEPLATLAYQHHYKVNPEQHAVMRVRQLFAAALGYDVPNVVPDYGLRLATPTISSMVSDYVVLLHGTTWTTKHWPETYWQALAQYITQAGYAVLIPWGNLAEHERAQRIASVSSKVHVLPKLSLHDLASHLIGAKAAVAVDTGLGHLAAALNVPTLSLYGPTNPELTGTIGNFQQHLAAQFSCSPCLRPRCSYKGENTIYPACFSTISPNKAWQQLQQLLVK